MAHFDYVSRFKNHDFDLPSRSTTHSAGYDMYVAEDILIPSHTKQLAQLVEDVEHIDFDSPLMLGAIADFTKAVGVRPALVSTGVKCYLNKGTYLELSVRSSTPLKHWLILANGVGVIDADYVDNKSNEGEIFFQIINLSPWEIQLKKGNCIGQGIIKPYYLTDNDSAIGERIGGFGSTK